MKGGSRVTSPVNTSKSINNSRNYSSYHPSTISTGVGRNGYYKNKIILKNFENGNNTKGNSDQILFYSQFK